ncbi:hypothetical protein CI109_104468 [Kwoniella shandongensis]|uniref:Uncharacterized protein n=1 Tax=Kwoniella shandongensis TaxID=1734106 RepID=A0A5M6BQZ5_9TREE|nr:uncharacterized protein CI109_007318 [Kwoniella shandongensis]KAA5524370.1 hypothetical protein CI109_007318 [Kwoniella shandongensis]
MLKRRTASPPTPAPYLKHVTRAQGAKRATPSAQPRNLQTYNAALANVPAPPVYASSDGSSFITSGVTYATLRDALTASCQAQLDGCRAAARNMGLGGVTTGLSCSTNQYPACTQAIESNPALLDLGLDLGGLGVGVTL